MTPRTYQTDAMGLPKTLRDLEAFMAANRDGGSEAERLRAEAAGIGKATAQVDTATLSEVWDRLVWRLIGRPQWIAKCGPESYQACRWGNEVDHPSNKELADAIRASPTVPAELVEYVAGRLDGTKRRPRGRSAKDKATRWGRTAWLRVSVLRVQAAFRLQGFPATKERVRGIVAKESGIDPDRLRDILRRDLDDAPSSYPSITMDEMEVIVREMIGQGEVELDKKKGLVWRQLQDDDR